MLNDLIKSMKSAWYYFLREFRRRRNKRNIPDPLAVPRFEMGKFVQGSEFNNVVKRTEQE